LPFTTSGNEMERVYSYNHGAHTGLTPTDETGCQNASHMDAWSQRQHVQANVCTFSTVQHVVSC